MKRRSKPPDEVEIIKNHKRGANDYWTFSGNEGEKAIAECDIATEALRGAGLHVENLEPGSDPPDCKAIVNGVRTVIEVTVVERKIMLVRCTSELNTGETGWGVVQGDDIVVHARLRCSPRILHHRRGLRSGRPMLCVFPTPSQRAPQKM